MNEKLQQWRKEGRHLPDILKDFHDQKDVFKAMHDMIQIGDDPLLKAANPIVGQCYVIDCFLWFMARHGYTMQRSRANMDFDSLPSNVKACKDERNKNAAIAMGLTHVDRVNK